MRILTDQQYHSLSDYEKLVLEELEEIRREIKEHHRNEGELGIL